jgi:hypothetical protein
MASLKAHIKAYCISCTYDATQPGTALSQIEACSVTSCKLYDVRPLTVATINLHRNKRDVDPGNIEALLAGLEDDDDEDVEDKVTTVVTA